MMQSRTILPILAVLLLLSPSSYVSSQNTRGGIVQPNDEDGHQTRMLGWLSDLLKKLAKEAEEAEEDSTDAPTILNTTTAPTILKTTTAPTISVAPSTSVVPTSRPVAAGAGVLAGQEAQETFPSPTSSPTKSPVGTAGQKQNQKTSDNSKNKNSKTNKKKVSFYFIMWDESVALFGSQHVLLNYYNTVYCAGQGWQEEGTILLIWMWQL